MDLEVIKATILANQRDGREPFEGLDSADIGKWNRALMFGENDEAWPGEAAWSRIVD